MAAQIPEEPQPRSHATRETVTVVAWNINSIRTYDRDRFTAFVEEIQPSIICFSEIKVSRDAYQLPDDINALYPFQYWNDNAGYSGTLMISKIPAIETELSPFDAEGRLIYARFETFSIISVYVPNSGRALARLDYRIDEWNVQLRDYVREKQLISPLAIVGDLNVIRDINIDVWNINTLGKAGVTHRERDSFELMLDLGLHDSYRIMNPDRRDYSFWSYFGHARTLNKGWRLDYILTCENLQRRVIRSTILGHIRGSDHAPVLIEFVA